MDLVTAVCIGNFETEVGQCNRIGYYFINSQSYHTITTSAF